MQQRVFAAFVVVCVLVGGAWGGWRFLQQKEAPPQPATVQADAEADRSTAIQLEGDKLRSAEIATSPVERKTLRSQVVVPGRLQYDDNRHVEIRTAVGGVVTEMRVKPGDRVEEGAVLAVASSPEIGQARADVLRRLAEEELARQQLQWAEQIDKGIDALISEIRSDREIEAIRLKTATTTLGEFRERLMSAYFRYRLAKQLNAKLDGMVETGSIAGRTALERKSEENVAEAALQAAIEQARHESTVQSRQAQIAAADARRRLELARQLLQSLLGAGKPADALSQGESGSELARVEIRAPFAGEIEQRKVSVSERVEAGDSLFVLADSTQLWVAADIREQEWAALELGPGSPLKVIVPALANETFDAELYYIGREVERGGNSLPLVARIDNRSRRLRPGLFVQVELVLGPQTEQLAVPEAAVQSDDGRCLVFVETGPGKFRPQVVETGATSGGWTEIRQGLSAGERVVSQGAFLLKSEQLLEGERE